MAAHTVSRLLPDSEHDPRTSKVTHVVLHHAATTSLAALESLMAAGGRVVSAHYAVKDATRVLKVPLSQRAFSLGDAGWDSRAVTVECCNESLVGWTISDESHESLAIIVADAAKQFGFVPHRSGDPKTWTVIGHDEVHSIHGGSYATACPGGMDLDRIVARAQQLMRPARVEEDCEVELIERTGSATFECSFFHPSFRGRTARERGYIVVFDRDVAVALARTWGVGFGEGLHHKEPVEVYKSLQEAAWETHDAYLRGLPAAGAAPAPVDIAALSAALIPGLVEALRPQFAAVNANIDDQPTSFDIIPKE